MRDLFDPVDSGGRLRTGLGLLLRVFSYLFHTILSLFLIGIASIAFTAGKPLKLDFLPWEGIKLNYWVLVLGIFGLICVVLAIIGVLRFLFPLWALFVFVMMVRGFFLTPYTFTGESQFVGVVALTFGALGAFLSSLAVVDPRNRRRRRI